MKKTMKNIYKLLFMSVLMATVTLSCNESEDVVTGDAQEAGRVQLIAGSSGSLSGAPDPNEPLASATINFSNTSLTYGVELEPQTLAGNVVSTLTVYKKFADETVEVTSGSADAGLSISLTSVSEFTSGLSVGPADLRVGDTFLFYTEMTMNDGRVIRDVVADVGVAISCAADLTGTYLVTNSWCMPSFTTEITRNPDGSYHFGIADGGGLHLCTANNGPGFFNSGDIREQCGEILPSTNIRYGTDGSGNAIGDVSGGSWDSATGTIVLENTQAFTSNWPSAWTSTYVRQ